MSEIEVCPNCLKGIVKNDQCTECTWNRHDTYIDFGHVDEYGTLVCPRCVQKVCTSEEDICACLVMFTVNSVEGDCIIWCDPARIKERIQ